MESAEDPLSLRVVRAGVRAGGEVFHAEGGDRCPWRARQLELVCAYVDERWCPSAGVDRGRIIGEPRVAIEVERYRLQEVVVAVKIHDVVEHR